MTLPMKQHAPIPFPAMGEATRVIAYPHTGPAGPRGERGERGPAGPASALPAVWSGVGPPPDYIPGSKPLDTYIDTATGDTYTLT